MLLRFLAPLFLTIMAAASAAGQTAGPDNGNATATATPALTPDALQQAVTCQGSSEGLLSNASTIFGDERPSWIQPVENHDHPAMLGLATFQLSKPVTAFGHDVHRISLFQGWALIELPRDDALAIVRAQHMQRAPIKSTEQYYVFLNGGDGPMLGIFAPTDDALAQLFGAPPEAGDAPAKTLFVGCNYTPVTEAEFLQAAEQADGIAKKAAEDIQTLLKEK